MASEPSGRALADTTSSPSRASFIVGVCLVVISAIAFSAKAVMAKLAYQHGVDALQVLTLRMGFALPVYLIVLAVRSRGESRPLTRRELTTIALLGVIGYYLASLFDFLGLQHISAGLERLILFVYPTLVALFEVLFFRRRLTRLQVAALFLTYAGIAVVFRSEIGHGGDDVPLGALLVFMSAVVYAVYLVGSGQLIPQVGSERFTALALSVSALCTLGHAAVAGRSVTDLPREVYELGLLLAFLATVLPTFLLAAGIRRIGSGPAGIVGTVGPVSTVFLAHVFLGEPVTLPQVSGALLVLAGATLVALGRPTKLGPHQSTVTR